jgi:hypothetical protein
MAQLTSTAPGTVEPGISAPDRIRNRVIPSSEIVGNNQPTEIYENILDNTL